jgi:hypothetical protein
MTYNTTDAKKNISFFKYKVLKRFANLRCTTWSVEWSKESSAIFQLQVLFLYSTEQGEVKIALCLIKPKHRNTKTQGETEIQLHTFLSL